VGALDFVFSLYFDDDPQTHPAPGIEHTIGDPRRRRVRSRVRRAYVRGHVDEIVRRLVLGQRVLVRCQMG
jgi:hypothetical protein